jgi:UPF0176 protein
MHHLAFYRFVRIDSTAALAATLRELTVALNGSILLAGEGINGMVAGSAEALGEFQTALTQDRRCGGLFAGMRFQHSTGRTPPFHRMKVHERREILPLGRRPADAVGHPGRQLNPAQWRELLAADDLVLIDNRNRFEHRLGHFHGAIDPGVDNFRDLPAFLEARAPAWKASARRVAMYCTGGIRCEKTAAWLDELGLEVLQLEGGILNYFTQMPDAGQEWQGECFVFDKRVALDTQLQESDTTAEQVYDASPQERWRLQRALRLDHSG